MDKRQRHKAVATVDTWINWLLNRGKELQLARNIMAKPADWRAKPENRKAWVDAARIECGIDDYGINESLKVLEGVLKKIVAEKY